MESFLASLTFEWLGSEVMLPMPFPDWLAFVKDDPDCGELLSEKLVGVPLVSRSVPGIGSWCVGGQSYT